jgi:type I restriction-modification system DNA methylase subunit
MQIAVRDDTILIDRVKYGYYRKAHDRLKSNLGKYYTPPHIVDKLAEIVAPYIDKDSIVLDPVAGAEHSSMHIPKTACSAGMSTLRSSVS